MSDLTPEALEHFASGTFPHERPSELDEYKADLRARVILLRDEDEQGDEFDEGWRGACNEVLNLINEAP